ncbi:hypothetical protein HPT29_001920 [Microvirga terrae]|uniref:Uncharacterized protein n=1 Tax=Microvirga terrae TaxID=2740529 RepID=A0ABY5RRQ9_9HYPH|nr:hypothetical protein [Microvirga terrae]UVF19935.1 hypothetical protein HPT29_001920 [Microvirga terrae]
MSDPQTDIARIQECIVEADLRISAQIAQIERMVETGRDTTEAQDLLGQLEALVEQWHVRRRIILDDVATARSSATRVGL